MAQTRLGFRDFRCNKLVATDLNKEVKNSIGFSYRTCKTKHGKKHKKEERKARREEGEVERKTRKVRKEVQKTGREIRCKEENKEKERI